VVASRIPSNEKRATPSSAARPVDLCPISPTKEITNYDQFTSRP
jgi:hypothetical protein